MIRPTTTDDLPEIARWWLKRGHSIDYKTLAEIVPPTGIINEGYSAMYYHLTADKVAFLEGFITNPEAPRGKRRDEAFRMVDAWLDLAKAIGLKRWFVLNHNKGIEPYLEYAKARKSGEGMDLWVGGGI